MSRRGNGMGQTTGATCEPVHPAFHEPLGLAALRVVPLRIPLRSPMKLASETVTHAETILVQACATDGSEGWGEAAAAPTMTGEVLPGMACIIERHLAPAVRECRPGTLVHTLTRLGAAVAGNPGARTAVEIALLDLASRRARLPLSALLGPVRRDRAPAILMIGGADRAAALSAAEVGRRAGLTAFKLKVGLGLPEEEAETLRMLRRRLGADAHLSADANMAWDVATAIGFVRRLDAGTLDYLEQPVAAQDVAGMARVQAEAPCPLCVDEGLHGLADIERHASARAAGGFGLKAIKLGGICPLLEADALCTRLGLRTTLACKIAETSIGAAATLHAAALVHDVGWGVSLTSSHLVHDVVRDPVTPRAGIAVLPSGPGLGVCPDPDLLDAWRVTP